MLNRSKVGKAAASGLGRFAARMASNARDALAADREKYDLDSEAWLRGYWDESRAIAADAANEVLPAWLGGAA